METKKVSLKTTAAAIAGVLFIELGFRLTTSGKTGSSLSALGIVRCLESILLVAIAWRIEKSTAAIGLDRSNLWFGFTRGLIWSVCFGMAAAILFLVLMAGDVPVLEFLGGIRPSSWRQSVIFLLVGGVLGPITEEIFFRGIIYGFLRQWGAVSALVFSTLFFVFSHPVGGGVPVTQLVGGIVFAVAYEKEKNLMVPITIHCLGNLAIFSLTILI